MTAYAGGAWLYDKAYGFKDYASEAARILEITRGAMDREPQSLLDVACGTGKHLELLSRSFADVAGVDLTEDLLRAAQERVPQGQFMLGDMRSFDLGRQFDVVTCLFSAIGYALSVEGLNEALSRMADHTAPGGVVIVEPWLMPEAFMEGLVHMLVVDEPKLKIARVNNSRRDGNLTSFDYHYVVGTPDSIEHLTERHVLMMFTDEEYRSAFEAAGLEVTHDPKGLMGRGLYIGRKH
jgi:trans-aconitate methyltransferase